MEQQRTNLVIFTGAGFSIPFGIPGLANSGEIFDDWDALTENQKYLLSSICSSLLPGKEFKVDAELLEKTDFEQLLTVLYEISARSETVRYAFLDSAHAISRIGTKGNKVVRALQELIEQDEKEIFDVLVEEEETNRALQPLGEMKKKISDFKGEIESSGTRIAAALRDSEILFSSGKEKLVRLASKVSSNKLPGLVGPLIKMLSIYSPTHINWFTTNYDPAIELFCRKEKWLECKTGFGKKHAGSPVPTWNGNFEDFEVRHDKCVICYHKLHGSVTWFGSHSKNMFENITAYGHSHIMVSGKKAPASMIFPLLGKAEYREPYFTLLSRLKSSILGCKVCLVIGHTFRDSTIRQIFEDAARDNENLSLIVVDPDITKENSLVSENVKKIVGKKRRLEVVAKKYEEAQTLRRIEEKIRDILGA